MRRRRRRDLQESCRPSCRLRAAPRARAAQGIALGGEAMPSRGEALCRDAMLGAEGVDHVLAGIAVMERRSDQVEALLWHLGVLYVQGESFGHAFERECYGNAAPADRDDEAWPGRREARWRKQNSAGAEAARKSAAGPHEAHGVSLQSVKANGFGDRGALSLHADRAVGDDPRAVFRPSSGISGISGMLEAQFLFDSFRNKT